MCGPRAVDRVLDGHDRAPEADVRSIGVGTRYQAVDRWLGRTVTFTVEITAFEPPRRMVASWSEPMAGGWEARLEPAGGGTDLTFTTRMEPSGLMGLLSPLMRPWAARQLGQFMADLRRWAGAQPRRAAVTADDRAGAAPSVAK